MSHSTNITEKLNLQSGLHIKPSVPSGTEQYVAPARFEAFNKTHSDHLNPYFEPSFINPRSITLTAPTGILPTDNKEVTKIADFSRRTLNVPIYGGAYDGNISNQIITLWHSYLKADSGLDLLATNNFLILGTTIVGTLVQSCNLNKVMAGSAYNVQETVISSFELYISELHKLFEFDTPKVALSSDELDAIYLEMFRDNPAAMNFLLIQILACAAKVYTSDNIVNFTDARYRGVKKNLNLPEKRHDETSLSHEKLSALGNILSTHSLRLEIFKFCAALARMKDHVLHHAGYQVLILFRYCEMTHVYLIMANIINGYPELLSLKPLLSESPRIHEMIAFLNECDPPNKPYLKILKSQDYCLPIQRQGLENTFRAAVYVGQHYSASMNNFKLGNDSAGSALLKNIISRYMTALMSGSVAGQQLMQNNCRLTFEARCALLKSLAPDNVDIPVDVLSRAHDQESDAGSGK